jgi:hypothetical protein
MGAGQLSVQPVADHALLKQVRAQTRRWNVKVPPWYLAVCSTLKRLLQQAFEPMPGDTGVLRGMLAVAVLR